MKLMFIITVLKLCCFYPTEEHKTNEKPIKSIFKTQDIENLFVKYSLTNELKLNNTDICSFSIEQKIALCEQIYQLPPYKDMNIHLSKTAMFVKRLKCERKHVKLQKLLFFIDDEIPQEMLPCYGRHDPIRTDYLIDDYYDKFYASSGLTDNSVIVYLKYDAVLDSNLYVVYNCIENFRLEAGFSNTVISIKEVFLELQLNEPIISTNDYKQIEYIDIKEKDSHELNDQICNIDKSKKIALCKLIFDQYLYRNVFWLMLNKPALYYFNVNKCEKNKTEFRFFKPYTSMSSTDTYVYMYPCFGRTRLKFGHDSIFYFKYLKYFYVSQGPRKNSIVVYYRVETDKNFVFYPIKLLENVSINNLKPIDNVNLNMVFKESKAVVLFTRQIRSLISTFKTLEESLVQFKITCATEEITKHKNNYELDTVSTYRNGKYTSKIADLFNVIVKSISNVISTESVIKLSKEANGRRYDLTYDVDFIFKIVYRIDKEAETIMEHIPDDDAAKLQFLEKIKRYNNVVAELHTGLRDLF